MIVALGAASWRSRAPRPRELRDGREPALQLGVNYPADIAASKSAAFAMMGVILQHPQFMRICGGESGDAARLGTVGPSAPQRFLCSLVFRRHAPSEQEEVLPAKSAPKRQQKPMNGMLDGVAYTNAPKVD
jgi:hypothetical protein